MNEKDQDELKRKEEHARRLALHALRMEDHATYLEQCGLRTEEHKDEIVDATYDVSAESLRLRIQARQGGSMVGIPTDEMTSDRVAARKRAEAYVRHLELTQRAEAWKDASRAFHEETAAWQDFFALRRRIEEREHLTKLTEAWRDGRTDEEIQRSLGTVPFAAPPEKGLEETPIYLSTDRDDGLFSGDFTLGGSQFSFEDQTVGAVAKALNAAGCAFCAEVVEKDGREQIKIIKCRPTIEVVHD